MAFKGTTTENQTGKRAEVDKVFPSLSDISHYCCIGTTSGNKAKIKDFPKTLSKAQQ